MAFGDWTLAGLRTRVKFRVQNSPKYTDVMVDSAINQAIVRLLLEIRNVTSIMRAETTVLTEGDDIGLYAMEYPLPDNTLYVDSLSFDGQPPLKLLTQDQIANTGIDQGNGTNTGDPYAFYVYTNTVGQKIAVLWPRPGRTATLEFWGGVKPDPLEDDDVPTFTEDASPSLEAYAVQYLVTGQPGEEVKAEQFDKKWKNERAEFKVNQGTDRIFGTRRSRDT